MTSTEAHLKNNNNTVIEKMLKEGPTAQQICTKIQ